MRAAGSLSKTKIFIGPYSTSRESISRKIRLLKFDSEELTDIRCNFIIFD